MRGWSDHASVPRISTTKKPHGPPAVAASQGLDSVSLYLIMSEDAMLGSAPIDVVKVDCSNRHVHLSENDLVRLFGPDAELDMAAGLAGMPDDIAAMMGFASRQT